MSRQPQATSAKKASTLNISTFHKEAALVVCHLQDAKVWAKMDTSMQHNTWHPKRMDFSPNTTGFVADKTGFVARQETNKATHIQTKLTCVCLRNACLAGEGHGTHEIHGNHGSMEFVQSNDSMYSMDSMESIDSTDSIDSMHSPMDSVESQKIISPELH